jgi:(p)ppGpp synthase/HD superfamily hydrolase
MAHSYAQTNIQLFNQLHREGYSKDEMILISNAYQLTTQLFTSHFRPSGKTFISHLVGTASILASLHVPIEVVAAGLLHAAYFQGDFGSITKLISDSQRKQIKDLLGDEVEQYIARYDELKWNSHTIHAIHASLHTVSSLDRDVVLIRLANELEDHLDLGILYRSASNLERRQRVLESSKRIMVEIADKLGFPTLATQLAQAFREIESSEVPSELRVPNAGSLVIVPKSCRRRLSVTFGKLFIRCVNRLGVTIELRDVLHLRFSSSKEKSRI